MSRYEKAYKEIIPAARAALITEFKKRYDAKEDAIACYVGITQAAISKYLNGKYSDKIKAVAEKVDRSTVEAFAGRIAKGESDAVDKYMCTVCLMLNDSFRCKFSRADR